MFPLPGDTARRQTVRDRRNEWTRQFGKECGEYGGMPAETILIFSSVGIFCVTA